MTRLLLFLLLLSQVSFGQSKPKKNQLLVDTSVNLYAFVGEKVSLLEYDPNSDDNTPVSIEIDSATGDTVTSRRRSIIMDKAFVAKYRVVQSVFNCLKTDTVVFKVFDHYGRPAFESHSTVLLYLSKGEDGNTFFHQKYQFDQVFKNKDGSWTGKNGETLQELFKMKKQTVFKARGVFKR